MLGRQQRLGHKRSRPSLVKQSKVQLTMNAGIMPTSTLIMPNSIQPLTMNQKHKKSTSKISRQQVKQTQNQSVSAQINERDLSVLGHEESILEPKLAAHPYNINSNQGLVSNIKITSKTERNSPRGFSLFEGINESKPIPEKKAGVSTILMMPYTKVKVTNETGSLLQGRKAQLLDLQ